MFRVRYLLLLIALALAVGVAGCSKKEYARFDGFYSNVQDPRKVLLFLKFYPDGTVTAALPRSLQEFAPVQLDKENAKECTVRGSYVLTGNQVVFKLLDKNGSADFHGEFREDKVLLKSHSNINGNDATDTYVFTKG